MGQTGRRRWAHARDDRRKGLGEGRVQPGQQPYPRWLSAILPHQLTHRMSQPGGGAWDDAGGGDPLCQRPAQEERARYFPCHCAPLRDARS
eukprot:357719-Rhodomonas_salina.1